MPATTEKTPLQSFTAQLWSEGADIEHEEQSSEITIDILNKYLAYNVKYGKMKGNTWGEILGGDRNYFKWMVMNTMNPATRTFSVLSSFLNESEKERAVENYAKAVASGRWN